MSNTFDPDLQFALGSLLRPQTKAAAPVRDRATPGRHPQVTRVVGRVISVNFGKR